jgi:putative sigma-54 modulation protein
MQLVLKGKNFIISDRIREYVEKKIGKLDRYLPDIDETRVEITEEKTKSAKDSKIVQITVRANGTILRAEERGEAIYACIDAVAEKMHRQIVRYKGKRIDRWQGQTNKRRNDYSAMPELEPEVLDALAEESERKIVRTKRFTAHPMNQDEAVEQMELLGHDFFVFFNAELGRINVLYRRADNNYGLLDPELV